MEKIILISLEIFSKKIKIIKQQIEQLDNYIDKVIKVLRETFIADCDGVPNSWLFEIINQEFINLVMAIRPDIEWTDTNQKEVLNFFEYWAYEQEFGGEISTIKDTAIKNSEWNISKTYNLENIEEVYDYIKNEFLN